MWYAAARSRLAPMRWAHDPGVLENPPSDLKGGGTQPETTTLPAHCHRPTRTRFARTLALVAVLFTVFVTTTATASARPSFRGVQLHSLWANSTSADMDRELDLAARVGANVVRVDIGWAGLEDQRPGLINRWYSDRLDRFMNGASARRIKVIGTLSSTPCWASTAPASQRQGCAPGWWGRDVIQYAPSNPADYARIARWITSRYGAKLAALEIWNEPNHMSGVFWKSGPAAYATLVKAAYPAAKAGDTRVPVLAGALSGSDPAYLAQLYANGIKGSYDGLSVHPYADPGFAKMAVFRATEQANSDDAPVWATEFGAPTGSDRQWNVSEAKQAELLTRDFADLDRLGWVGAAVIYNLRDKGTDSSNMEDNFGLVRRNYAPKPAYAALRAVLGGPAGAAPAPAGKLSLRLVRRGASLYAKGTAPSRSTVKLKLSSCKRNRSRAMHVMARRGRFWHSLGKRSRMVGCHVTARVTRLGAFAASARVR